MKAFDIERARRETRGAADVIHFNNAGASLMSAPVADALRDYLALEERYGGYETVEKQAQALQNFYSASAKLLNCSAGEVAFLENATRAWDWHFMHSTLHPATVF